MTAIGPKLLEFNVRLGDPETQCLMHSYGEDFAQVLEVVANGGIPDPHQGRVRPAVCVVIAAEGYPGEPVTDTKILGIGEAEAAGAVVFQAGTRWDGSALRTAAGRVVGVTAGGTTLQQAVENAYGAVSRIRIDGSHYRTDIGKKGLLRW